MASKKDKTKDKEETPDTSTWSKVNPRLTAVMPGAVMDHDQARLAERERTAALNGQGADAVAASVGMSVPTDVGSTSVVSESVTSSAGTTSTSSDSVTPSPND